jgi:hypothetical protein
MHTLLATALLLASSALSAATVGGKLSYPSEEPAAARSSAHRVHRQQDGRVLTQEFLWSGGQLEKHAASAQSAAEFCAVRMR